MELTFQYFFLIKWTILAFGFFALYKLFTKRTKLWAIITFLSLAFILITPVKMDNGTTTYQKQSNYTIQQSKTLPPKVEDNSFEESSQAIEGITENDLP